MSVDRVEMRIGKKECGRGNARMEEVILGGSIPQRAIGFSHKIGPFRTKMLAPGLIALQLLLLQPCRCA
jgi:hypothetical protein